jgi:hypothetical protein
MRGRIIVYTEHQSLCPFVGIRSPHSLPRKRVCPPWTQMREEQHSLAGEWVGGPNSDDWQESLVLCILMWLDEKRMGRLKK